MGRGKRILCKAYKRCKEIKYRNDMANKRNLQKFSINNLYVEIERFRDVNKEMIEDVVLCHVK